MNHVILHIPHASTFIPPEEMDLYTVDADRLARENLLLADLHTDQLYDYPGAARAVFPVSRFVVDPERFSDDAAEPMAAKGMGALYQVATDLTSIRPIIPPERRKVLLNRYYWPHHNQLDFLAKARLDTFGLCLIFDCHSYPSRTLPYEREGQFRPQIGIGTDPFHTASPLKVAMEKAFADRGYEVGIDTPFAGALVPNAFYGRDPRVQSVMIEVRRDLYMDEATGIPHGGFDRVRKDLTDVMRQAAASFTP